MAKKIIIKDKYAVHKTQAKSRPTPEEMRRRRELREERALLALRKAMKRMEKQVKKVEKELSKYDVEGDRKINTDIAVDANTNERYETNGIEAFNEFKTVDKNTQERKSMSEKCEKYDKVLNGFTQEQNEMYETHKKKGNKKVSKKIKKMHSLSRKMIKKYDKYTNIISQNAYEISEDTETYLRSNIQYGDSLADNPKKHRFRDFFSKLGDAFIKSVPSLLRMAVKAIIPKALGSLCNVKMVRSVSA